MTTLGIEADMELAEKSRKIASYLRLVLGGKPTVNRYWDDRKYSSVDILSSGDGAFAGVTTYATIGLYDYPINLFVDGVPLRVELLAAFDSGYKYGPNILASCAFNMINSGAAAYPGAIIPKVLEMYSQNTSLKHAMLVDPFLWQLEPQRLSGITVAWLQAVPISDAEKALVEAEGSEALENIFEANRIDVADLKRLSAI